MTCQGAITRIRIDRSRGASSFFFPLYAPLVYRGTRSKIVRRPSFWSQLPMTWPARRPSINRSISPKCVVVVGLSWHWVLFFSWLFPSFIYTWNCSSSSRYAPFVRKERKTLRLLPVDSQSIIPWTHQGLFVRSQLLAKNFCRSTRGFGVT